jgi:flagellar hook-length control protein FliK
MMASHDDGGAGQQWSMNDDVEQPVRDGQATRSPLSGATADFHASTQIAADAPAVDADTAAILTGQKPDSASAMKLVPPPAARIADPVEARFAEANHPRIVTAVQSELMPSGGTVRLRLDPPELGALLVRIDVKDGVLAASFQTSNDEATRLLSRSMQQLRTTLESHGVTVEKLHVQQAPREQWDGGRGGDDRQQNPPQHWQQQEQQRREMLQRMWRRVRDGRDPFDLVA